MAQLICQSFIEQENEKEEHGIYREHEIVGRRREVEIEGIYVKVKFNQANYYDLVAKLNDPTVEGQWVTERQALEWCEETLDGGIRREDLDLQRQRETNVLDMMQNSSIIYHPESLFEMQIMCIALLWAFQSYILEHLPVGKKQVEEQGHLAQAQIIFLALTIEHCCSLVISIFRQWDIATNGKLDINGVPRAKTESTIELVQIFVACLLTGYTIRFLASLDGAAKVTLGFACTWMCVDCGLVALARVYIQNAMFLKKTGEITKNIYTLYFLQQTRARERQISKAVRRGLFAKLQAIMAARRERGAAATGGKAPATSFGAALAERLMGGRGKQAAPAPPSREDYESGSYGSDIGDSEYAGEG